MGRQLVIRIEHDQDVDNPSEDGDGQWQLYSFNTRHVRFKHPDNFTSIGFRRKLQVGLAFKLAYYEHGLCRWSFSGEGPQCPWDSVQFAGVLVWEEAPENMGPKTYDERKKDAAAFLEVYTDWCNGQTYYYVLEDEDGSTVDSCGGFIGLDHLFDGIADAIEPGDTWTYANTDCHISAHHEGILQKAVNCQSASV